MASNQDVETADQDDAPTLEQSCIEAIASKIAMRYIMRQDEPSDGRTGIPDSTISVDEYQQELLKQRLVSEELVKVVCKNGHLDDKAAEWFSDQLQFSIQKLYLKMAGHLTKGGLKALFRDHVLTEIHAQYISEIRHTIPRTLVPREKEITVGDIIDSMNSTTKQRLLILNVSGVRPTRDDNLRSRTVYVSDSSFKDLGSLINIQSLNVSSTYFVDDDLKTVVTCMKNLKDLNISDTYVQSILCLKDGGRKLERLGMNNHDKLRMPGTGLQFLFSLFRVFRYMTELRHLDISIEYDRETRPQPAIDEQSRAISMVMSKWSPLLVNLKSLDISGRQGIEEAVVQHFYANCPHLEFIGLLRTSLDDLPCFTDRSNTNFRSSVKVTGTRTEAQIKESLTSYYERPIFAMETLYSLTTRWSDNNVQIQFDKELLELSLRCMMNHHFRNNVSRTIQTYASICVCKLTVPQFGLGMQTSVLTRVLKETLDTLKQYKNDPGILTTCRKTLKNCLTALHEERILKDMPIDYYKTAHHAMRCLSLCNDASVQQVAVTILSKLSAKISTEQTLMLGSAANMKDLLQIVERKVNDQSYDEILNYTIDALQNLIRESVSMLHKFHDNDGLILFSRFLMGQYPQQQATMLNIMYNSATVPSLRQHFLEREGFMITSARYLLRRSRLLDEVCYFAAGIISHIAMLHTEEWDERLPQGLREACLADVSACVSSWNPSHALKVDCSTLKTFFPLLQSRNSPQIQLWAAWAIRHFFLKGGVKYREMLIAEQGIVCLQEVNSYSALEENTSNLVQRTLFEVYLN